MILNQNMMMMTRRELNPLKRRRHLNHNILPLISILVVFCAAVLDRSYAMQPDLIEGMDYSVDDEHILTSPSAFVNKTRAELRQAQRPNIFNRSSHDAHSSNISTYFMTQHRQLCVGMTGEECRAREAEFTHQAEQNRRRLSIFNIDGVFEDSIGKISPIVIFIRFSDHLDRDLPSIEDLTTLIKGDRNNDPNEIIPTGSVVDYFTAQSYGKLSVEPYIVPFGWVTAPDTEAGCADGGRGLTPYFQKCFRPALDKLDELDLDPDSDFEWFNHDENFDFIVDSMIVLHSGYPAEIPFTDEFGTVPDKRIQSHATSTPAPKDFFSLIG